jgi:hypothetical protein
VNTGGTTRYAQFGERVCLKDKAGNLLLFEPSSGGTETLKLRHSLHDYSPMHIDGNCLYTSLEHKSKPIQYAACISLE